jgi:uracil-DNA glycosylase
LNLEPTCSECRRCERLAEYLSEIRQRYPTYYAKPVAAFGDADPALLIVGLAPGMHGANRTGRPFTGDHAGILLYRTLHKFGFSNLDHSSSSEDGLRLTGCRITNAVRCVPPRNHPSSGEISNCNSYLAQELSTSRSLRAVLMLGSIAHQAVLSALALRIRDYPFRHGACYRVPNGLLLYSSYHCSRYNVHTKRLSTQMFEAVFQRIQQDFRSND